tara:strand:+ start:8503 stop:9162 length:660 start_codon:yes stop_codon:yes gene_type:complete
MKFSYLKSTIGKKQVMAVAGLLLAGFVLTHMLGNMLLFVGADMYNLYSYKLISNPLIYLAEAGLVAFFLSHIVMGIVLSIRNKSSRQKSYAVAASGEKKASWSSRFMIHQGMVIAVFVVLHLLTFKFADKQQTTVDGVVMDDLHQLVVDVFQSPVYVIGYVIAVGLLAFHLSHGVHSALSTLGFYSEEKKSKIECLSAIYGWVVGLGFMSQPIYVYLFY